MFIKETGAAMQVLNRKVFFKRLVDTMKVGVIVTDADGYLVYGNQTYTDFLNIEIDKMMGKYITDVVENSRLHIVAGTGQAEINYPHKRIGIVRVCQRLIHRRGPKG